MTTDRNCLTHWFPKLAAAGVPVPRTEIVDAGVDWHCLLGYFDDPEKHPAELTKARAVMEPLAAGLREAAARIGPAPYFLRTGQGSGKHHWQACCDLRDLAALEGHILSLVEWSQMVDMMGLSSQYWVIRERLPVKPIAVLANYGGMPLVREMRCFIAGNKVICHHPYWPRDAIRDGLPRSATIQEGIDDSSMDVEREREADRLYAASLMDEDAEWEVLRIAKLVAEAFDNGYWSVDILESGSEFHVTDMAIGQRSFHWPDCSEKK